MAPLTRELFIEPDLDKKAIQGKDTIWVIEEDTEDKEGGPTEIRMPAEWKALDALPEGYTVDFAMDPATVVESLRRQGVVDDSQLPEGVIIDMRRIINGLDNIMICPVELYESKLALTLQALNAQSEGEDEDEGGVDDADGADDKEED